MFRMLLQAPAIPIVDPFSGPAANKVFFKGLGYGLKYVQFCLC